MSDYLVIKCNMVLHPDKLNELYQTFTNQADKGTILLPSYCDAVIVPEGMLIEEDSVIKVMEV